MYELTIEQTTFSFDANLVLELEREDGAPPELTSWWAIGKTEREANLFAGADLDDVVFPMTFGLVDGHRWTTEGKVTSQNYADRPVLRVVGDATIEGLDPADLWD